MMTLTEPLFSFLGRGFSGRDLILIGGGLFLLWKSVHEIHNSLMGAEDEPQARLSAGFAMVLVQIAILDIVFSLDSVITPVGTVDEVEVMGAAIVIAVVVMMVATKPIGDFVDRNPTIKILALSFLIMVGTALVAEGFTFRVPKGYIYFAMAFSVAVEIINIRMRKRLEQRTVRLRKVMNEYEAPPDSR
jgi:predicted tellurium resistance membrane protein TerC